MWPEKLELPQPNLMKKHQSERIESKKNLEINVDTESFKMESDGPKDAYFARQNFTDAFFAFETFDEARIWLRDWISAKNGPVEFTFELPDMLEAAIKEHTNFKPGTILSQCVIDAGKLFDLSEFILQFLLRLLV